MRAQNRVKEALGLRGMTFRELSKKTGINRGAISAYVNQKYQPKQISLTKMAVVLDVSEMWLAGYDVPSQRPQVQKKADELATLIHRLRQNEKLFNLCLSITQLNDSQFSVIEKVVDEFQDSL